MASRSRSTARASASTSSRSRSSRAPRSSPRSPELIDLPPDEVDRINRELSQSRGFQPVSVADNIPYEQYAAITVRLPELPGVAASRGFPRFYPGGSAVGQLVGYVGAASAAEYEKENKNPLLLDPRRQDRQGRAREDARADLARRSPAGSGSKSPRAASWSRSSTPSPTAAAAPSS